MAQRAQTITLSLQGSLYKSLSTKRSLQSALCKAVSTRLYLRDSLIRPNDRPMKVRLMDPLEMNEGDSTRRVLVLP